MDTNTLVCAKYIEGRHAYAQVEFFERPPDLTEFGWVMHGASPVLHCAAPLTEKERRQIVAVPLRACARM